MGKLSKKVATDSPDLAEPFLDEASTVIAKDVFGVALPELTKDLPVLRYVKTASDVYSAYRLSKLHRKLKAFLDALIIGNFKIEDFNKLPVEEQRQVVDILVTELDNQSDNLQAEAMGYLFNAYIIGNIDRLTFLGIAHELKNTNPLVFYFNVDGYKLKNESLGITIEQGSVHYLPNSFVSNSSGKLSFVSTIYLTNLGRAFFENVYTPMSQRHII